MIVNDACDLGVFSADFADRCTALGRDLSDHERVSDSMSQHGWCPIPQENPLDRSMVLNPLFHLAMISKCIRHVKP